MATGKVDGTGNIPTSREEYLKRYLSTNDKKKKKQKSAASNSRMRLLDEEPSGKLLLSERIKNFEGDDEEFPEVYRQKHGSRNGPGFKQDTFVMIEAPETKKEVHKLEKYKSDELNSGSSSDKDSMSPNSEDQYDSDQEVARPTRQRYDSEQESDISPRRQRSKSSRAEDNSKDMSPLRRKKNSSSSPSSTHQLDHRSRHKNANGHDLEVVKQEVLSEEETEKISASHEKKTMDGKMAGLVRKEEMINEIWRLKAKKYMNMQEMDPEMSGKDAETRHRQTNFSSSKKGRRQGSPKDDACKEREALKQLELEEKYKDWNRGVAQIKERSDKLKELEEVIGEGFARYQDDESMNEFLKTKSHEEDPMAEYFKVKNHKVKMKTGTVYPTYSGQWPQNRFSIAPGYRWDGVDRSNGFEGKYALTVNKRRAQDEITYRSIAELTE